MSYAEKIILAASVITSLTTIFTVFTAAYKFLRKEEKWRAEKDAHDRENYLSILRLTITATNMPKSERIIAGDKYIALGGNGAVKHLHQQLVNSLGDNNPPD